MATSRGLVAMLENCQESEGSLMIRRSAERTWLCGSPSGDP